MDFIDKYNNLDLLTIPISLSYKNKYLNIYIEHLSVQH